MTEYHNFSDSGFGDSDLPKMNGGTHNQNEEHSYRLIMSIKMRLTSHRASHTALWTGSYRRLLHHLLCVWLGLPHLLCDKRRLLHSQIKEIYDFANSLFVNEKY